MKNAILAIFTFAYLGAFDLETSIEREDFARQTHAIPDHTQENEKLLNQILNYIKNHYHGFNIIVYVNEGIITLKGMVKSDEDKDSIENEVKGFAGVHKVQNELQVKK